MTWPLPRLLAGPILRRTDEKGAWVWIATTAPVDVTAIAYTASSTLKGKGPVEQVAIGNASSMAFGAALHLTLVGMQPPAGAKLTGGRLYAYNLEVKVQSSKEVFHLDDASELQGPNSITYGGYALPTFFVASPETGVNLLHGSCRKAHGDGDDALAGADALLRASFDDLKQRPSALFLTGDQIYADEVDEVLARPISEIAAALLGFDEETPIRDGGAVVKIKTLIDGYRGDILKDVFTPTDAQSHVKSLARNQLVGFGEYAALHVLYWNQLPWGAYLGYESENIRQFRGRLGEVRRALANIPTYMMLDDHDITDDWNRTKEWTATAEGSPIGRRIIANGLVAAWAFQLWGNDPSAAVPDFVAAAGRFFAGGGTGEAAYEDGALAASDFSFVAPTYPPAVVVDMRTTRGPDPGVLVDGKRPDPSAPPEILGAKGLDAFVKLAKGVCDVPGKLLVVVAPPPVVGYRGWEWTQEVAVKVKPGAAALLDLESWHADPAAYHRFLIAIVEQLQPGACLFLSGDLHFGHLTKAVVSWDVSGKPARHMGFTQFTCSALKNRHSVGERLGLRASNVLVPEHAPEWVWKPKPPESLPRVRVKHWYTTKSKIEADDGPPDYRHRAYGIHELDDLTVLITDTHIGRLRMDNIDSATMAHFTYLRATGEEILTHDLQLDWRPSLYPRPQ